MESDKRLHLSGYIHLLVIYIVWGTTYLAIRVAVRSGAGFPPFALGAMRLFAAGLVLLLIAKLSGTSLKLKRSEFIVLAVSGCLLWNGGNGLVMVGETAADSGYTALLVSTTPIWASLVETIYERRLPHWLLVTSLIIGFIGLLILSVPTITGSSAAIQPHIVILLLLAPLLWAIGSVFQKRNDLKLNPIVASAYQQLFGAVGFVVVSLIRCEPLPSPTPEAWLAYAYLVIFGSLIAFTSYTLALRLLPIGLLMTYAYVNPVVAVFLGWLILGESVGLHTVGGTLLILVSVACAFKAKHRDEIKSIPDIHARSA